MTSPVAVPGFDGLTIARATPADAPELLVLQRACWVTEAIDNDRLDIPALHESLDDVRRGIAEQQTWVVRDGARLVATVRGKAVGDAWEVGRLGVVPDLVGRGLGRALLAWIEEHAPADIQRFQLFTGGLSARNQRMYGRAGYELDRIADGVARMSKPARESGAPAAR